MKTVSVFTVVVTLLVGVAMLSYGGSAFANSGEQSTQASQDTKDKKQSMGMRGDMPACCHRMMGRKAKSQEQKDAADSVMESMEERQTGRKQTAKIAVTENGFEPSTIRLKPNTPAQLTFVRQTDKTCATSVSIPDYKINRELPLNKPVVVEFTPKETGEFTFACGMNMLKGKLVVEEKDKS